MSGLSPHDYLPTGRCWSGSSSAPRTKPQSLKPRHAEESGKSTGEHTGFSAREPWGPGPVTVALRGPRLSHTVSVRPSPPSRVIRPQAASVPNACDSMLPTPRRRPSGPRGLPVGLAKTRVGVSNPCSARRPHVQPARPVCARRPQISGASHAKAAILKQLELQTRRPPRASCARHGRHRQGSRPVTPEGPPRSAQSPGPERGAHVSCGET